VASLPRQWLSADVLADAIIEKTHGNVRLATPLGLGKANHLINAIYRRAAADAGISLKIHTALTLEKPVARNELEARFLAPLNERLYAAYEDLEYIGAIRSGNLPSNIHVTEFFLRAGAWLNFDTVQQNYICANYSEVPDYILAAGINVVVQLIATDPQEVGSGEDPRHFSLSCNPDITLHLLDARRAGKADFLFAGEVNHALPYMGCDAEIAASELDHVLYGKCTASGLFVVPKRPIQPADYAIGFHAARLIPDGGTLQIGIGSVSDALAHALILRQKNNTAYRAIIHSLAPGMMPLPPCDDGPFEQGLYGASEMLMDTFLDLIEAGVVSRDVAGRLIDAAFFVGTASLYERLRGMTRSVRDRINMTRVSFINNAHRDFEVKNRDRRHARFINNGMKATLLGAVVSDSLDSGRVVSGIGGQFDFVRQAFALDDARSIIMINSVREGSRGAESNIVWQHTQQTIPRHLRDIIVTEYGVADLRGKNDAEVIGAMLAVTDMRFQDDLIEQARHSGKLPKNFAPPPAWRRNRPESVTAALSDGLERGMLPAFPFGSDLTAIEQRLIPALERLKRASRSKLSVASLVLKGMVTGVPGYAEAEVLERMDLHAPTGLKERFYHYLLRGALNE
jgi:acyl-CoA hydrolase